MKSRLDADAITLKEIRNIKESIQLGDEFDWLVRDESLDDKDKGSQKRKRLKVIHKSTFLILAEDKKGRAYSITYIEIALAIRAGNERLREMLKAAEIVRAIKAAEKRKSEVQIMEYISGMAAGKMIDRELPACQYEKAMKTLRKSKDVAKRSEGEGHARRYFYNKADVEKIIEKFRMEE